MSLQSFSSIRHLPPSVATQAAYPADPAQFRQILDWSRRPDALNCDRTDWKDTGARARLSSRALEALRGVGLFTDLLENEIKELADLCRITSAAPGESLVYEGDERRVGFMVLSGRVALIKSSADGKELAVELLVAGDILGLLMALEGDSLQTSARAQTKAKILWLPAAELNRLLLTHTGLCRQVVVYLLQRLHSAYRTSRSLAHDRVRVRVAAVLAALALKFAGAAPAEYASVIEITRRQIADLAGTSSETAIRVTRALQRKGIIDLGRPGVIRVLNLAALQKIAEKT